jgi:hypothetical protein
MGCRHSSVVVAQTVGVQAGMFPRRQAMRRGAAAVSSVEVTVPVGGRAAVACHVEVERDLPDGDGQDEEQRRAGGLVPRAEQGGGAGGEDQRRSDDTQADMGGIPQRSSPGGLPRSEA